MKPAHNGKVDRCVRALNDLKEDNSLRSLKPRRGIDFASNDHLALANAPRMKKAVAAAIEAGTPTGAGGSRLLRRNCEEHECLEGEAAKFFGAETTLFLAIGYVANFSVLTRPPQRGYLLVLDSLVHGSIHEGARAGRAEFRISAHNDALPVEDRIREWRAQVGMGRIWIVVESLYSMDSDFAPLDDLVAFADRHDAFLMVDEAHATGVHGKHGRGLTGSCEGRENLVVISYLRQSAGRCRALVTASTAIS
ncbi:7-keto-8-aminopelargonate synthetase-like enzyme [Bradyrhizobium sp. USDA 3650]